MCRLATFLGSPHPGGPPVPRAGYVALPGPEGVGFLGLPHYARLPRPWTAVGAMGRSCAASGGCSARWTPYGCSVRIRWPILLRAGRSPPAQARGAGRASGLPSHMRTRHPRRSRHPRRRPSLEAIWRGSGPALPAGGGRAGPGPPLSGRRGLPIVTLACGRGARDFPRGALARSYDGELTLLSVGRLDPEKNPLLLADVLARRARRTALATGGLRRRHHERGAGGRVRAPRRRGPRATCSATCPSTAASGPLPQQPRVPARVLDRGRPAGAVRSRSPPALPVVATAVGGVPELAEGRSVLDLRPRDGGPTGHGGDRRVVRRGWRCQLIAVDAGLDCACRASARPSSPAGDGALRRETAASGSAITVIQRSWIWAVLPEQAAEIDSHGDPALAEVLARQRLLGQGQKPRQRPTPCCSTPRSCPAARPQERGRRAGEVPA